MEPFIEEQSNSDAMIYIVLELLFGMLVLSGFLTSTLFGFFYIIGLQDSIYHWIALTPLLVMVTFFTTFSAGIFTWYAGIKPIMLLFSNKS